jgi:endonuclease/exonuclease/phosphatase family metal-dependent hydrolase
MDSTGTPWRRAIAIVGTALAASVGTLVPAVAAPTAPTTTDTTAISAFGVATYNVRGPRHLTAAGRARLQSDVLSLAGTAGIDVIGFQESRFSLAMLRAELPKLGWEVFAPRGIEDPIAWRASRFSLATDQPAPTAVWQMSEGNHTTARTFPDRYLTRVRLVERVSDRTVEVFNTHVNQFIEKDGVPRHNPNWTQANLHLSRMGAIVSQSLADVTVLTGDLNVDAVDDARVQRPRLPYARYATLMANNYRLLGIPSRYTGRELGPSRPCRLDYVFLKTGNQVGARMTSQAVLRSYRLGADASDHAPVLVRFEVTVKAAPTEPEPTPAP